MATRSPQANFIRDAAGGLSLAGLLVPEAIAYSGIAGLPAAAGLAAAVVGPIAYATIGRGRLVVVSATSGAAAVLAAAVDSSGIAGSARTTTAAVLIAFVGMFLLLGALLRLASLTNFISRAVLQGFGFGLAVTIAIGQLPKLLGLAIEPSAPWVTLYSIAAHLGQIHLPSLLLGATSILLLKATRRFKAVPAAVLLTLATILAMRLGPADHLGIAIVGPVSVSIPMPGLPSLPPSGWSRLAQLALPIALVILAESWATIKALANANHDIPSPEREIAALGIANVASTLCHGLPVGAGFSASNANASLGTVSRLGAVIAAFAVLAISLLLPDWIAFIPRPLLAGIVIFALLHALSLAPIAELFRLDRDQWVACVAAVGVLALGIMNGLLFAIALSLVGLLRRLAYPRISELGQTGTHDFVDCAVHSQARRIEGVLIVRPNAPLFFANADAVLNAITKMASASNARFVVLSLEESDDLDSTAVEEVREFVEQMAGEGRSVRIARAHDQVRWVLARAGLAELSRDATYSVADAIREINQSEARS